MMRISELEEMLGEIPPREKIRSRAARAQYESGPLSVDEIMAILEENRELIERSTDTGE